MQSLNTKNFVGKAEKIHGSFYDYSKTEFVSSHDKIVIICPIHKEFLQTPTNHLSGQGCKACGILRRTNLKIKQASDKFKERSKKIHGDRFTYHKALYVGAKKGICITCHLHGDFFPPIV